MNINSAQPVTVIEKDGLLLTEIEEQSGEPAIQFAEKTRTDIFVAMHQTSQVTEIAFMAPALEIGKSLGGQKIFAGEDQADRPILVPNRLRFVRERAGLGDPAEAGAEGCKREVARGPGRVVAHPLHHAGDRIALEQFGGGVKDAGDSGHRSGNS